MSENNKPNQRKRTKVSKASQDSKVSEAPISINSLLNDALKIIGSELTGYKKKTERGVILNLKEARVVSNYLDTLTRASKEAREQARSEDLSNLSDEELVQLASQLGKSSPAPKAIQASKAYEASKVAENTKDAEVVEAEISSKPSPEDK